MMKHLRIVVTLAASLTFIMLTCFYDESIQVRRFKTFSFYRVSVYVKNQFHNQTKSFARSISLNTTIQTILSTLKYI